MNPPFKVVIPARYASTRLPAKPLSDIHGRPMIEWVYRAAADSDAQQVIVATDDARIEQAVKEFGGECVITRADHQTGSDRIVEACGLMGWDEDTIIVNLQGDEPLMPAANLSQVARNLAQSGCEMATLHKSISAAQAEDPNLVKLVANQAGRALYFSRAPIPYNRDDTEIEYCGHIGLYAYRIGFLNTYAALDPCRIERNEKLEQLRALYHGYRIHTEAACADPGPGVDTEEDLKLARTMLERH
jgi:3-deoxy-manno-octulosonate cytidylyltransferase (CMP-KDO synthetase)